MKATALQKLHMMRKKVSLKRSFQKLDMKKKRRKKHYTDMLDRNYSSPERSILQRTIPVYTGSLRARIPWEDINNIILPCTFPSKDRFGSGLLLLFQYTFPFSAVTPLNRLYHRSHRESVQGAPTRQFAWGHSTMHVEKRPLHDLKRFRII